MKIHSPLLIIEIVAASILFIGLSVWWTLYILRARHVRRSYTDKTVFPNAQSKFETINGVKIHYVSEGKGSHILLLHGIGANIFCWRHLIPLLAPHFTVWAVDIKGFGLSDKPANSSYGLMAQAHLLLNFLKHHGVHQACVVGNSMGGAIALEMALQKPDQITDLVLINSAYDPKIIPVDLRRLKHVSGLLAPLITRGLVRQVVKRLYGKTIHIPDEVVDAYYAPYLRETSSHRAFLSAVDALVDETLLPRLKKIKKRVLVLWGKNDKLTPLKTGESLHRLLPMNLFFVHPTGGHHLQEEEPKWVADHIKTFLRPQGLIYFEWAKYWMFCVGT